MASRLTAQQIRKQARQRAVEAAAKQEESARERFEADLAEQRARAKANEEDLGSYYGAEAAILMAEDRLAEAKRSSAEVMSNAVQAMVSREGSVRAAALLLGVPSNKISALAKGANGKQAQSRTRRASDTTQSMLEIKNPATLDESASQARDGSEAQPRERKEFG